MNKGIYIIISILLFTMSCYHDKKSELFSEHLKNNLSLNIEDQELNFFIYQEEGCNSCNIEFENYFDTLNTLPNNIYIVYMAKYPVPDRFNNWQNKYKDHLLWDRTDNMYRMNIRIGGSGRVVWKNNKIAQEKTYFDKKESIDSFVNEISL